MISPLSIRALRPSVSSISATVPNGARNCCSASGPASSVINLREFSSGKLSRRSLAQNGRCQSSRKRDSGLFVDATVPSTAMIGRSESRVGNAGNVFPFNWQFDPRRTPPLASKPMTTLPSRYAASMPAMTKGDPTFVLLTSKPKASEMPELEVTGVTTVSAATKRAVTSPIRSPRNRSPFPSATSGRSASASVDTMASSANSRAQPFSFASVPASTASVSTGTKVWLFPTGTASAPKERRTCTSNSAATELCW